MDDFQQLRRRQDDLRQRLDSIPADFAEGTHTRLGQVYDAGSIPTALPGQFALHPATISGTESEGSAASFSADTSKSFVSTVVGGRVPVAGDVLIPHMVGGRWVAQTGKGSRPCKIPKRDLKVTGWYYVFPYTTRVDMPTSDLFYTPDAYGPGVDGWISNCLPKDDRPIFHYPGFGTLNVRFAAWCPGEHPSQGTNYSEFCMSRFIEVCDTLTPGNQPDGTENIHCPGSPAAIGPIMWSVYSHTESPFEEIFAGIDGVSLFIDYVRIYEGKGMESDPGEHRVSSGVRTDSISTLPHLPRNHLHLSRAVL